MTTDESTKSNHYIGRVLTFSSPMIMNMIVGIFPTLCSMWFLARLGKDELAAAALASSSFYTILTFFVVGFSAVGIKIGHSLGKGEANKIGVWLCNGLVLAIVLSIPATLILLNLSHLLLWMGQKPHLVAIAQPFFMYGSLAIIMMLINSAISHYFSGIGHPKVAFFINLITMPIVIALSYTLVLGKFGFHQFGLGGINLASFCVDLLMFISFIIVALSAKWSTLYKPLSHFSSVTWQRCKELIKLGWPISVQVSAELLAITIITYLIGLFGADALAATQITQQFILIFVMIVLGLTQAISILVSQAHGSGDLKAVYGINRAGIFLVLCLSFIFAALFFGMPTKLVDLYLDSQHMAHGQVVDIAVKLMAVGAIYNIFDGVRNVITGTLRGIQDAKIPMQIGIICLWVLGLPLAVLAGFVYPHGPVALRAGFTVSIIIATIWLWFRYKKQMKNR